MQKATGSEHTGGFLMHFFLSIFFQNPFWQRISAFAVVIKDRKNSN